MASDPIFNKDEQGVRSNSSGGQAIKVDAHVVDPTAPEAVQIPPYVFDNAEPLDAYADATDQDLEDAVLIDQDIKVGDNPDSEFDVTGPVVSFVSPLTTTTDTTPTFDVTSDDANTTYEFKIDAGSWVTGTDPYTTDALSVATHTISVRGTNDDEQVGPVASHTFGVTV